MTGDGANERAPPGEDEEVGQTGLQPIAQAAWRALKQMNMRRKVINPSAEAPNQDQH